MRTTKPKTHFEGKRSRATGPEIAVVLKHNLKHPKFREAAQKQNLFYLDIGEESDVFYLDIGAGNLMKMSLQQFCLIWDC